jgi:hypothetical protein
VDQNKIITTQIIEDVVNRTSSDRILVRDLVEAMESIGFGLAMMIFSLGIIIPLPPPFPSIIALPLLIFSMQMILGYCAPKLPKMFSNLSVKRSVVAMLVRKSAPYIRKIEAILRPRWSFMISPNVERIIGFFTLVFAAFIAMPIPFSNFIPGIGILIISFGLLGKDGLVVCCGIFIGLIGMAVSIVAILLGVEALYYFKNLFLN